MLNKRIHFTGDGAPPLFDVNLDRTATGHSGFALWLARAATVAASLAVSGSASAKDLRIGVVNMQRAVSETREGKAAESKLLRMKKKLEAELNRKLKEFQKKEEAGRKAWQILKDAEKRKRLQELQGRYQALQKRYVEAERDLMKRKTQAMLAITRKLNKVIATIAKRRKMDYIFANAAVLWAPKHVDLTNEVIREYNDSKR